MKKSAYRLIRFGTPILCLLLLLPSFCLWAVAETQSTENGMSSQALESAEALDLQRAELVSDLDEESLIFNYVDRSSFIEAGHVERVCEDEEPNTYVFKNADGSKTVYFLDEDVKYVNAGGEATEKKLDLVALDGGYTTRASNVSLALPNAIASGVTLAYNGNSVTLTPKPRTLTGGTVTMSAGSALTADGTASAGMGTGVGMTADLEAALMEQALQIAPVGIASGKADYQGAFGTGTTLRYTPTLSGVKEDVILDAYRGQNTFAFTLNTGNLSVFEEEGRYFIAPTADAEEKILISDTWVYDSAGNFEKGTLSVVQVKNGLYLLTVGASVEFLTDENTVYPVYIDPTLEVKSGTDYIEDVTVFEGIPNINCGTFLYNTVGASSSYGRGRTAIRLTGLINHEYWTKVGPLEVVSTKFHVKEASGTDTTTVSVYPLGNDSWTELGATWNNIGVYDATQSYGTASLENSKPACFDITELVTNHWKDQSIGEWTEEQGFILVSENETTPIKQFYSSEYSGISNRPYVVMTYIPSVTITPDSMHVQIGEAVTLGVKASMDEDIVSVTWSVNDESIASIDSNTGVLIGNAVGTVIVTAVVLTSDNMQLLPATKIIHVVPLNSGAYLLRVPGSTLCLTAQSQWQFNGMEVALENAESSKSLRQFFSLDAKAGGKCVLYALFSPTNCVVPYQNGVSLWDMKTGFNGNWAIEKTADEKYTLQYPNAGYLSYNAVTRTVFVSETMNESAKWDIVPCTESLCGAKLFDTETGEELISATRTITQGDQRTFNQMNLQPVLYSTENNYECSWSSSDTTVARMNAEGDGIVGVSPGTATITGTITSAGLQGSCSFTVTVQPLPDGIYYLKNPSTLKAAIVNGSAPYSGSTVTMQQPTAYYTHLWKFEKQSDGYYTIRSHFDNSYYLTAPSTNSSGTRITLQNGSLTDSMKWALTVTESGNFKLTSKGGIGTSNVLTVSSSTGTLFEGTYVEDEEYFDEWLIRKNEVYYVEHYYDRGFNVRYSDETVGYDALDVIKEAEKKFIRMMDDRFGITVISTYRLITSAADECKILQSSEGAVTFESLGDVCTHASNCLTTDKLHEEIPVAPQAEVGRVIWTGHALTGNPSSEALQNNKTAVITLRKNSHEKSDGTMVYETNFAVVVGNYADTLRHELGHLLSLPDHYCYKKEHGHETCQNYCDICVENREKDRICIMSKTEENKFCTDCYKDILEYLSTLDNKVGE